MSFGRFMDCTWLSLRGFKMPLLVFCIRSKCAGFVLLMQLGFTLAFQWKCVMQFKTKNNLIFSLLQYGSDEFTDSPRYTSPGTTSGYYLADGTTNAVGGGEWPPAYTSSYQNYETYGLIPEPDTGAQQGLPPMSSLRPNGAPATTIAGPGNAFASPNGHPDAVVGKALGSVSVKVLF